MRSLKNLLLLIITTVHACAIRSQSAAEQDLFRNLLRATFAKVYDFCGWSRSTILLEQEILSSIASKLSSSDTISMLRNNAQHPAWRDILDLCAFVEEFVFYYPLHCMPKPNQKSIGLHLSSEGSMDFSLIQRINEMLNKSVDKKEDSVVINYENEKASLENFFHQRATTDKSFYEALLDWAKKLKSMGKCQFLGALVTR